MGFILKFRNCDKSDKEKCRIKEVTTHVECPRGEGAIGKVVFSILNETRRKEFRILLQS